MKPPSRTAPTSRSSSPRTGYATYSASPSATQTGGRRRTVAKGKFTQFLERSDSYVVAKSPLRDLLDEAKAEFPEEPGFFDKLAAGTDIFLVYAGKVDAWREKWFGV